MENDKLMNFASCYKEKGFPYRFVNASLLFIMKAPFISCSNLNDAKTMIIYNKDYKTLGVIKH